LVRGEKETAQYKATLVGPILRSSGGPSAVSRRTVRFQFLLLPSVLQSVWWPIQMARGPSAPYKRTVRLVTLRPKINTAVPLVTSSHDRRTVRGWQADRPLHNFCGPKQVAVSLLNKPHTWRTVRLLPADRPLNQISICSEYSQFSQFQLQYGIIAHIKIKKSQILHENLPNSHMSKL
jgi:hypothetical protein